LVLEALALYRRYPFLFLVLAAAVLVPYEAIVLLATGVGPFEQGTLSFGVSSLLTLADIALVSPLVSALHVHAVLEAGEGGEPRLAAIARKGLRVLPVVAVVSLVSWFGITLGFLALLVPGVLLTLRWFVVAQTAAIEHEGWRPALRRSADLTDGHYGHVFLLLVYACLIVTLPAFLIGLGFDDSADVVSFLVGVAVQVVGYSLAALVTAVLYFDLRARWDLLPDPVLPDPTDGTPGASQRGNSWDPRDYAPEDRPKGWYIDPKSPNRMRYWDGGDPPDWGRTTVRTPRKIRRAWRG
jgi:hypothetical protein